MKILSAVAALVVLATLGATAQTTSPLSDAEVQGRALAQKILSQWPAENFTNTGVLKIRDAGGKRVEIPVRFQTSVTASNCQASYSTWSNRDYSTWLMVTHSSESPNVYQLSNINAPPDDTNQFISLAGDQTAAGFARSDFSIADLGLEFFHWPQQKVLKREVHRSCGCTVLESTNPNPAPDGYSRVRLWIDTDTFGIVEAYAYDAKGKQLKDFYPKDFTKVNGRWQVQTLVMENVQTGSRSRLEFDLKK
jgi:hypothetical protein